MEEILHQLIDGLSHYLKGFNHPWWCRISSIHSSASSQGLTKLQKPGRYQGVPFFDRRLAPSVALEWRFRLEEAWKMGDITRF
jgi:hypothetical protein